MKSGKKDIEDLVEFYNQWPDLRGQILDLLANDALQPAQKKILRSMIHVVDCVGPADLSPDK